MTQTARKCPPTTNQNQPAHGIKPLLKWTGGKYREYKEFKHLLPLSFSRYVEPFSGGAGVFFALNPNCETHLNDTCTDLIDFYAAVKEQTYKLEFISIGHAWEALSFYSACLFPLVLPLYRNTDTLTKDQIPGLPVEWDSVVGDYVLASLKDKIKRIRAIERKEGKEFSEDDFFDHTETAIRAGVYNYLRAIINNRQASPIPRAVAWFFVREFCYSSMFRFSKGLFNIPYGGISYNSKKISTKIDSLNSCEVHTLFNKVDFSNEDFEVHLNSLNANESDFIFLDPPYDSIFSTYDDAVFDRSDHTRLAAWLSKTTSRWMMVISYTDFIHETYGAIAGVNEEIFDKNYMHNARNRTNRNAMHVVYRNYQ